MDAVYTKGKTKIMSTLGRQFMPPMQIVLILALMIGFIIIAKGSLAAKVNQSLPIYSANQLILEGDAFNETETGILMQLYSAMNLSKKTLVQTDNQYILYFNTLKEYMKTSDISIKGYALEEPTDLLSDLKATVLPEQTVDIQFLSPEDRKIVTVLLERIYSLCGLKVTFHTSGVIEKIAIDKGKELYTMDGVYAEGTHIDRLFIATAIVVVLIFLCVLISRKKQLYKKEVIYDGFDKERYA